MSGAFDNYHERIKLISSRVLQKLRLAKREELFPHDIMDLIDQSQNNVIGDVKIEKIISIKMLQGIGSYLFNNKNISEFIHIKTSWNGQFTYILASDIDNYGYTGDVPAAGYIFGGKLYVLPAPGSDCGTIDFYALLDGCQNEFDPEAEPELPSQFDEAWITNVCSLIDPEYFLETYAVELNKACNKYHNKMLKEIHVKDNW